MRIALHQKWKNIYDKGYSSAIRGTLEYIENHFSDPELSISEISEAVHFSVSRLCAVFKKETGKTINDYLTDRRIEEAKILLHSGSKVYETSIMVGYSSSQYFSRIFQQRTGCTPTEYK